MGSVERGSDISGFKVAARKIAIRAGHVPFPSEVVEEDWGLIDAEDFVRDGYGLVILLNHFSKRDPLQVGGDIIYNNEVLRGKRVVAPVAYHQSHNPLLRVIRSSNGVEFIPIVTPETTARGKNDGLDAGEGLKEYLSAASENLSAGGIVLLAPQGTRRESLEIGRRIGPVGLLVKRLRDEQIERTAFLFVGVGVRGAEGYSSSDIDGYNVGQRYELNIGRTLTKEQLMREADDNIRNVDNVVLQELADVVPASYSGDFLKRQREKKILF